MKPKIEVFGSLTNLVHVGYRRTDMPGVIHTIHAAEGGAKFQVHEHFADCVICKKHGVTQADFNAWYDTRRS